MKATILINSKENIREIPTAWEQVTFKTFLDLDKCGQDIVKVIALLTQIDYDILRQSKIVNMDQVIAVLGFLNKPAVPVIPKTLLGYKIPKGLEFEQVQMYVDLKNYVTESQKLSPMEQLERYTLYCAVYACMEKHGKYDWELAEQMKDEFLKAPCTEVLGIGNFTLLKLIGLNLSIDQNSRKVISRLKRLRLVLEGWRIRMVSRLRWIILSRKLGVKRTNY